MFNKPLEQALDVLDGERVRLHRHVDLELLVDLVTPNLRKVVALGIEEQSVHQVLRVIYVYRLAGTLTPEDLQQRILARGRVVALQRVCV